MRAVLRSFCRRSLIATILLLASLWLPFQTSGIAQSTDSDDADAADAAFADTAALELQDIALLQFRTYDQNWVRYINADAAGKKLLQHEGVNSYPFRTFSLELRLTIENLETPSILGAIVTAEGMEYSEEAMSGNCLTETLSQYGSNDILCVPGSSAMSPGHAITVIYHPETGEIVAVSTSVDNTGGAATNLRTRPAVPDPTAVPAGGAPAQQKPDSGSTETTCGPWKHNQWLPANEYWTSGLELPVDYSRTGGETPDYYNCVVPGDGNAPYLLAGVDPDPTSVPTESQSSSSSDDDDDDDACLFPYDTCNPCPWPQGPIIDYQTGEYVCATSE